MIRVQKWLQSLGIASRREAESWIDQGRIKVNGKVLREQGVQIDPDVDRVELDGRLLSVSAAPKVYWAFHKPRFTVCSTAPQGDQKSIYDLPSLKELDFKVATVGRLDFQSEGLLLLTNDGDLTYSLTHPKFEVERSYSVLASRKLESAELKRIAGGQVVLEDGPVKYARIEYIRGEKLAAKKENIRKGAWYNVSVKEGRNRLIRRLFESFGVDVVRLMRTRYGSIYLSDEIDPGKYRQLSPEEIKSLKALTPK